MNKFIFLAAASISLGACMGNDSVPVEQAVQIEQSKGGSSVDTVVALYQAGDYAGAFAAIPEQSLANRMRASSGIASIAAANGMSKERAVVEEILCADYNRCDVVGG